MKRKRLPPDKRLDWRDPNMPVFRPAMAEECYWQVIRKFRGQAFNSEMATKGLDYIRK